MPAAWARWLIADWVTPSRFAAWSYDAPASTRSATSQPRDVRRFRTAAQSHSVVSSPRTPGLWSGSSRRPQPPGRGLGGGDRVAGVEVGRAATRSGALGEGLLDLPDADADVPAVLAQQSLDDCGQRGRVVEDALELVTAVRSNGRSISTWASASRVAGTRSVACRGWSRAGRW